MADKITRETTMAELIARSPRLAEAVKQITGSDCAGCPAAGDETLELYAILHGLDPDDLLRKLNAVEQ
jgi:hybrid cluster-associated redox disulfide protein